MQQLCWLIIKGQEKKNKQQIKTDVVVFFLFFFKAMLLYCIQLIVDVL